MAELLYFSPLNNLIETKQALPPLLDEPNEIDLISVIRIDLFLWGEI